MRLTHRQETFIHRLLDLYRELDGPVHYSVLAERIGVSPITAYDMLRLLEEKGLVKSEYRLDSDKPVVGRSEVVFSPTAHAHRIFEELAGPIDSKAWEDVKSQILENFQTGDFPDKILAEEMLARIPPDFPEALRYCAEVISLAILRMGGGTGRRILATYLPQLVEWKGNVTRSGLLLFSGFLLGLLAYEDEDTSKWKRQFIDHFQRYQALVLEMEPRYCRQLGEGLSAIVSPTLEF